MGIIIRQSLKATLVSYGGAVIGAFSVIFLYPKCLNPEQIGLIRTLTEAAILCSFFAQMGMTNVSIKFFSHFNDSKKAKNGFFFIITVIPLIGFSIFTIAILFFQDNFRLLFEEKSSLFNKYMLFLIPLTFFFMYITLFETYSSLLQRIVVPKIIREIVVRILTIVIIVLYFFKIISIDNFVVAFTLIYGLATILNILYLLLIQGVSFRPSFGFIDPQLRKNMISFMLFMIVVGIGSNISSKIDVFMIGSKISLAGTGIFTIAFFIASFIDMPSRAMFQITTPFISEALKNNDFQTIDSLYKRVSINQLTISGLLFLIIWLNADNIFRIMPNGHIYESSKYVILFIGLAKVFDAVTGINTTILGYSKYYYYILFFIFILALLTIVNNLLFIPIYGIVGSALATAIAIFLYNTIMVWFVKLKFNTQPFSIQTLKVVLLIGFVVLINSLTGNLTNAYLDAIIRSVSIISIFLISIYRLKVSKDINDFIDNFWNEHIRTIIPFAKRR